MRHFKKWVFRALQIYIVVIIAALIFGLVAPRFPSVARLERRINPADFAVWLDGTFHANDPVAFAKYPDIAAQFSTSQNLNFEDVDYWLLILESPSDIKNVELAGKLGLDVADIASWDTDANKVILMSEVVLRIRWGLLPVYIARRRVAVINSEGFAQSYELECHTMILYRYMVNEYDGDFLESCKIE